MGFVIDQVFLHFMNNNKKKGDKMKRVTKKGKKKAELSQTSRKSLLPCKFWSLVDSYQFKRAPLAMSLQETPCYPSLNPRMQIQENKKY